jgi:glycosyltransferase involved in cell wall biosynthesis
VAPPEEPELLAAHVRRLLDDPAGAAEMGRRGRELVFRDFDRDAIAGRMESLLLSVSPGGRA